MSDSLEQKQYQYLDRDGLVALWGKIKENFVSNPTFNSQLEEIDANFADIQVSLDELSNGLSNVGVSSVDNFTIKADARQRISTCIGLNLDSKSQTIQLVAQGSEATEDNKILSSISYASFIKDGLLNSVELVIIEETIDGNEPGTYLKFTFNTDSGKNEPIYVNVTDLVNVYEGTEYVTVENNVISLNKVKLENDLKSTFVTLTEFESGNNELSSNIQSNLDKLTTLTDKFNSLETQVLENKTNIDTKSEELSGLTEIVNTQGETLSGVQGTLSEKIAELEQLWLEIGKKVNEETVTELSNKVTANTESISGLSERIASLENATTPDGELVTISINQVTDFGPITNNEIDQICTLTEEVN